MKWINGWSNGMEWIIMVMSDLRCLKHLRKMSIVEIIVKQLILLEFIHRKLQKQFFVLSDLKIVGQFLSLTGQCCQFHENNTND